MVSLCFHILLVVTDTKPEKKIKPGNEMWNNTNRTVPERLCELFVFGLRERLDGLLLHAHGEQGLQIQTGGNTSEKTGYYNTH